MKTLDRYILRNFLFTLVMFFVVGVLLRAVVDLFFNADEFAEQGENFLQTVRLIFSYYGYQSVAYFAELGGVILVASAVFTLARMNKTNELTAMLAAGVSLHRVLLPIVLCAMAVSGLIMADQEFVIPPLADRLVRTHDNVMGDEPFQVRLMADGSGAAWYAPLFWPAEGTMRSPVVFLRNEGHEVVAKVAQLPAADGAPQPPAYPGELDGTPGWYVPAGYLARVGGPADVWQAVPSVQRVYTAADPARLLAGSGQGPDGARPVRNVWAEDDRYGLRVEAERFVPRPADAAGRPGGVLERPRFVFAEPDGRVLAVLLATSAAYASDDRGGYWDLAGGTLFVPSDLTPEYLVLRRSSNWLDYMSTSDLNRLLRLKRVPDERAARLARLLRFFEPLNHVIMLLLGVPFILSRERNVKAAAALCLLMVMSFYAFIYICRYIDQPPVWAAGLPTALFAPVAVVMVDSIKT